MMALAVHVDTWMTLMWYDVRAWGIVQGHRFRWLIAAAVMLFSVADLLLTQTILTMVEGRTGVQPGEANAFMAPIVMTWWAWPLRVGIPLIMVVRDLRRDNHWLMFCGAVLYGAVVAWNTHMFFLVNNAV